MATGPRTGNPPSTVEYRVLIGLTYGSPYKRAEPGEVVSDLPAADVGWLVEQNAIRPVADEPVVDPADTVDPVGPVDPADAVDPVEPVAAPDETATTETDSEG